MSEMKDVVVLVVVGVFKLKKLVVLLGVMVGNIVLCMVGKIGNDLYYCGYDILDVVELCEFEEIVYLLVYGMLLNLIELVVYKIKLCVLCGLLSVLKVVFE